MRLSRLSAVGGMLVAGAAVFAWAKEAVEVRRMPTPPAAAKLLDVLGEPTNPDRIESRLRKLAEATPPHSPVREAIEAGDLTAAREMLSFRPRSEAPLPEGFPPFTPVGLIEVKQYPAYRRAKGPGFWPLFQHIQKQGIPMTAPVEMPIQADSATPENGRGPMAFLYQNTRVGALGPIDGVEVIDASPARYASLGARGGNRREALNDARQRIASWVEQSPYYRIARDNNDEKVFRVLGYSSPMIPEQERYWEVQLRVELAKPENEDSGALTN